VAERRYKGDDLRVSAHPWLIEELDLAAYLARVGLEAKPPSRAALDELHEAHVRTFTFDNIDVLLRRHPGVALPAVQEKFVGRGRGGYCFEHSTLFAAVLERLGYDIERRLSRVGDASAAPRTHMVVVVTLDGQRLFADPGFGMSLLRPIPLEDGAEDDYLGWQYRVHRVDGVDGALEDASWELHRLREAGWELMHTTDELTVRPVDVAMGHHFTSTYPTSHFTRSLMLTRHETGQHTTVAGGALTVRRAGEPTEHRQLTPGELPELLHSLSVPLSGDEEARLLAVLAELER
jgi:arylamine N-acetyltransferase